MNAESRALVARTTAELRQRGWPVGRALGLIAGAMPAGESRTWTTAAAAALERGETPAGRDLLLALLARGDAATPQSLAEAARAAETSSRAQRTLRAALRQPAIVLAVLGGTFLLGPSLATGFEGFSDVGGAAPALTRLALTAMQHATLPGLALVVIAALLVGLAPQLARFAPGGRALLAASRLREYVAAVEGGLPPRTAAALLDPAAPERFGDARALRLDRFERLLATRWLSTDGAARAAARLADELEEDGSRIAALWIALVPLAGFAVTVAIVGSTVLALYLSLFTLTNALS